MGTASSGASASASTTARSSSAAGGRANAACCTPSRTTYAWSTSRSRGRSRELDGWAAPNELPLHTEVLRSRRDVTCVVHAHPLAVVAADLAGLRFRPPLIDAFDIPGTRLPLVPYRSTREGS
ncbi:class II aldolase/adducin family protein [Streptomyces sp. bgisy034]|uniref:class II aldolase/adducin family protein n=1 Tax=Streptomyces sp. bgisy034 TaxID=3413774 RepID=UPI003EBE605C